MYILVHTRTYVYILIHTLGPSGIIGTNIPDAKETATAVIEDMGSLKAVDHDVIERLFENINAINWKDYMLIEEEEITRGKKRNPPTPREKIVNIGEQLKIVHR